MALVINTNVSSLTAQRALADSNAELQTAMERLSTGSKINSAADDAAGTGALNASLGTLSRSRLDPGVIGGVLASRPARARVTGPVGTGAGTGGGGTTGSCTLTVFERLSLIHI